MLQQTTQHDPAHDGVDPGEVAVLAHALLGATAVICGTARTLTDRGDAVPDRLQHELLQQVDRHGRWVAEVLGWLARGLPAEALAVASQPPR